MMTETTEPVPATVPLLISDRCDQCGAQALVRYVLAFSLLQFCSHHANRHHEALLTQSFTIDQDIRKGVK